MVRQTLTGALAALFLIPATSALQAQSLITRDEVSSRVAVLGGAASFTPTVGRPHSTGADYALELTAAATGAVVTNGAFLNTATSNDVLVVAFWVKKYDRSASSAFSAVSPSSPGTSRGFQAHVPWSDNTIYFDTAGCCAAGETRINESITVFPTYTDDTWWSDWHHFVFMKNGADKQIWIDGQLFLQGQGTTPLPTDITQFLIGRSVTASEVMHGQLDDFAIFGAALSDTDIGRLFSGTAPDELGAASNLLAYWTFNDAQVIRNAVGTPVGFTISAYDVGTSVLDTNTINLTLNNSVVTPTRVTKTGLVTGIEYLLPNPPFAPGSTQTVSLTIRDAGGNTFTNTSSFVVGRFETITPDLALPASAVNKSNRGFKILTYQVDNPAVGNGVHVAESILAGLYGPNVANTTDLGGVDAKGYFTWPTVINFDVESGIVHGWFNEPEYPPSPFPGIPGNVAVAGPTERFACEFLTALEFTNAGLYTMVVNSDDCFATTVGTNPADAFSAKRLGAFDAPGGRGAADTAFQFFVQQPGIYGFRTVYQQGGGGGNIEWFMINSDGTRVLVNDITNSIPAYQWVPTIATAYVRTFTPGENATGFSPEGTIQAVIADGATQVPLNSVSLRLNGEAVNASVIRTNNGTLVTYIPSPILAPKSQATATLAFGEAANAITEEWSFTVAPYSRDSVSNYLSAFQGVADFTPNAGGRSGAAGDFALELGTTGTGLAYVRQAGEFMNPAAINDQMTFSLWAKSHILGQSSAFWANATSASGGRGWQAHIPWDGSMYFDTAGCCGADTRISSAVNATTYPPFTGTGWWTNWHNFVFTKNGPTKQVWIDGTLLVEGTEAGPLPTDFTDMYMGAIASGNAHMRGALDDFAVFSSALTPADIAKLAAGQAPTSLTDASKLVAYWDFNDATTSTPSNPTISAVLNGSSLVLTFTGTLQSSEDADGPYTNVTGATSPYNVDTTQAAHRFYRSAQQ